MRTKADWGQTTAATATATASFQRYTGKPERWRLREPGKLVYIIPRHNRANLWWRSQNERGRAPLSHVFCKVHIGSVLGISLNIDCMEKAPAGFRFTFPAFSATSSNYNNEPRRNDGTQTPREISIMSCMHESNSSVEADSLIWVWYEASCPCGCV